jgi:hypothetical protein
VLALRAGKERGPNLFRCSPLLTQFSRWGVKRQRI